MPPRQATRSRTGALTASEAGTTDAAAASTFPTGSTAARRTKAAATSAGSSMSTSAATKPKPAATSSRATATKGKGKAKSDGDELAEQLQRVLKVSEPEPQAKTVKTRLVKGKEKEKEKLPVAELTESEDGDPRPVEKAKIRLKNDAAPEASVGRARKAATTSGLRTKASGVASSIARVPTTSSTVRPKLPSTITGFSELSSSTTTTTVPRNASPATTISSRAGPSTASASAPIAKPRCRSPTAKTVSSTKNPVKPLSSTSSSASTSLPSSRTARAAAQVNPSRSSRPSTVKPKATARTPWQPKREDYNWAMAESSLSAGERARAAMDAIKSAIPNLSRACKSGYQYGSRPTDGWDEEKVERETGVCGLALEVLREMDERKQLGDKGIEVEKAGQGVVAKMLSLGMNENVLRHLVIARKGILRQYQPRSSTPNPAIEAAMTSSPNIPREWLELTYVPAPEEGTVFGDPIRSVCFQSTLTAWIAMLNLYNIDSLDLPGFMAYSTKDNERLNPLQLAMDLPREVTTPVLNFFTRRLNGPSMRSAQWLHLLCITIMAVALTATAVAVPAENASESSRTPGYLWSYLQKWFVAYMERDEEDSTRIRKLGPTLLVIVNWVQVMVDRRGEKREAWFSGTEWMDLLDTLVQAAKKIRDTALLGQIVQLMTATDQTATAGEELTSTTPPQSPGAGPSRAAAGSGLSESIPPLEADSEVRRICAQLAKTETVLLDFKDGKIVDESTVIDSLEAFESSRLAQAFRCLPDDTAGGDRLERSYRATERVRRRVIRLLDPSVVASGGQPISKDLMAASQTWLIRLFEVVESALPRLILSDVYQEIQNFMLGQLESLRRLASHPPLIEDVSLCFDLAGRAQHLLIHPVFRFPDLCKADFLRSFTNTLYSLSFAFWKAKHHQHAFDMASLYFKSEEAALELYNRQEIDKSDKTGAWAMFLASVPRRRELAAYNLTNLQKREEAYSTFCAALASISSSTVDRLIRDYSTKSLDQCFEGFPAADSITRISWLALADPPNSDPVIAADRIRTLSSALEEAKVSPIAIGILCERIVDKMAGQSARLPSIVVRFELLEIALRLVEAEVYPLQRLRLITNTLILICMSSYKQELFDGLVSESQALLVKLRDQDVVHQGPLLAEYENVILLAQALNAYRTNDEPTQQVAELSTQIIARLRQVLVPPSSTLIPSNSTGKTQSSAIAKKASMSSLSKSASSKTAQSRVASNPTAISNSKASKPVSAGARSTAATKSNAAAKPRNSLDLLPKFEDFPRLVKLLSALAALLGVLGHPLAKIDTLKVLRAFLRHHSELVDDYVSHSAELATEYRKLGKNSRAASVFAQTLRTINDGGKPVSSRVVVDVLLQHCEYLAAIGDVQQAADIFTKAEAVHSGIDMTESPIWTQRVLDKASDYRLSGRARTALAAICLAKDDAASAIRLFGEAVKLSHRSLGAILHTATEHPEAANEGSTELKPTSDDAMEVEAKASDGVEGVIQSLNQEPTGQGAASAIPVDANPFVEPASAKTGQDEPKKEDVLAAKALKQGTLFDRKYPFGIHWQYAETWLNALLDNADAVAQRGSVADTKYFLNQAEVAVKALRSSVLGARVAARFAQLQYRLRHYEASGEKLGEASTKLALTEGPDAVDIKRIQGDLFTRQEMVEQAGEVFATTSQEIQGLDTIFSAADALLPTPKKNGLLRASLSASIMQVKEMKEPLLPATLAHVLRQQAWLLRDAGQPEESDAFLKEIETLADCANSRAENSYFDGKLALLDAFDQFKSDLFMSSLTESTIAMPMGNPGRKITDRQSSRHRIQIILDRAEQGFQKTLSLARGSGRIEEIRQACLSLALLRAFQTSLGQGSPDVTAYAAHILACTTTLTLHREYSDCIDAKYLDFDVENAEWPVLTTSSQLSKATFNTVQMEETTSASGDAKDAEEDVVVFDNPVVRQHWKATKEKYATNASLDFGADHCDLSSLPTNWTVISINVTDDRNTMFISRHENGHEPLVFSLPLDRQSKREGDDDLFSFDEALKEMRDIIKCSNERSRAGKLVVTDQEKKDWWLARMAIDQRLKELLDNIEFCWLGAFKTIFSPRINFTQERLDLFRQKLEKVFFNALSGTGHDLKRHGQVHLNDSLLECFANLSSKCRDEEVEDLVYLILDIYQFHGVPVALAELDMDQIGIDVKTVLSEMEHSAPRSPRPVDGPEHVLLALDHNAQAFPWESIPTLRGRPVSRIPSLPILLDLVAMGRALQSDSEPDQQPHVPNGPMSTVHTAPWRRMINTKRVAYVLNSSGDLLRTQQEFEPWLKIMSEKAGWRGIVGRAPSELEMAQILKENELVLYFGHGGAEQYIRGNKVRALPQCAATFLWGCSSGRLEDNGDLDASGTAWNYLLGGCPALTATLWDVTDREIDRVTTSVFRRLALDNAHVVQQAKPRAEHKKPGLLPLSPDGLGISTVEAVCAARDDCQLKYLTGAAVVCYGIPVYLH